MQKKAPIIRSLARQGIAKRLFERAVAAGEDPIATGVAGAAIARSAVAKPVSSAKRVSNNRKNRPYSNPTRCI